MINKSKNFGISIKEYDKLKVHSHLRMKKMDWKTVTMTLSGFIEVTANNPKRELNLFYKGIRQTIDRFLPTSMFHKKFISVEKIPESFEHTKKCFYLSEITFFLTCKPMLTEVKDELIKISDSIYEKNFENQTKYKLYTERIINGKSN